MRYLQFILILLTASLTSSYAQAQKNQDSAISVTGAVFDATTNEPIEAATVRCGQFSSGFTDTDGKFEIDVRSVEDVITVETDNYHSKDIPLRGETEVNIYINPESMYSLQGYTYDAYDKKQKIYTTQSVASTNPQYQSSASKMNAGSGEAAFDGHIAGLDVRSRNGIKGMGSNLFLRGYSSLFLNNQPLVVVDGMIFDTKNYGNTLINGYYANPLSGINVNDIENVTVIRDAASIYGAKAANGVIFIRTSHTNEQATTIELSVNGNIEMAPENIPLLGSDNYRTYLNEIMVQKYGLNKVSDMDFLNTDVNSPNYHSYHNNTNWQDKVFEDSYSTNYNLKIKGGDDVALYALSVGFLKQNGTVEESGNSRFNFRFNSDINFSPEVTLNSNISFNYSKKDISGSGINSYYDPVYISRIKAPFLLEYEQDENGITSPVLSDYDFLNVSNPVALINNMTQEDITYRLFGSFNFNWKISDKVTVSDLIGLSFDKDRQRVFVPTIGVVPDSVDYGEVYNQMKTRVLRNFVINNDLRVKYHDEFGFNHKLNVLAGARLNINDLEEDWAADFNSANDQMQSLGNGNYLLRQNGGFIGNWSSLTWYLSADYSFKQKYLLSLNMSLDGSSRFGDELQGLNMFDTPFLFYPSVSAAWLVSSENFMAGINAVDLLKLRASFGQTGNDDIGNYTSKKYYTSETFLGYQGIVPGNLWNPALGPEKTAKMNVGIDLSVFKERVSVTADIYNNKTTNLFDYIPATDYSGLYGYYGNYGGLTTKGFDVSLNTRIVNSKPFKWDLGLVYSQFTTTIDELYNDSRYQTYYTANILTEAGSPISQFYGYKTKGVYASDNQAAETGLLNHMDNENLVAFGGGDMIFEDYTPDGIIDENDMQVIGNPTPDFMGEVFTKLQYKNLSLDASLAFSYGGEVFNYMRYTLENMSTTNNQTQAVINRWRHQGQETDIPRASFGDPMGNARFSDRWIEDGSYARLKNVTLSYMIPFNTFLFKYAEVYATGVNLLTFTKYKGQDPEFSIDGAALLQGIDLGMVPQNKMVLVGIRVGL
ncbi:MAG: SusC/RagA family TonB-linked outer membrane protein [Prolixibacteraceae bacterium]|jgi:TonB-linked SusC/RagA family outer membrane protein|nr:SusC/RagA family TonB-linked outer membrane protein [Prolixibacteraceae bacterium]